MKIKHHAAMALGHYLSNLDEAARKEITRHALELPGGNPVAVEEALEDLMGYSQRNNIVQEPVIQDALLRSRLASLALSVLNSIPGISFEMEDFVSGADPAELAKGNFRKEEDNVCGTSCCLLGHAVFTAPILANKVLTDPDMTLRYPEDWGRKAHVWADLGHHLLGEEFFTPPAIVGEEFDMGDNRWKPAAMFLFDGEWPSKRKQTARRVLYYIMNGLPKDNLWEELLEDGDPLEFLAEMPIKEVRARLQSFV